MKNYIIYLSLALFFALVSCSDEDYEDLNRDPNNPSVVSDDALYNSAVKSLFDQMESTNVNRSAFRLLAQYWTETTYTDEANYDLNNRNIPGNNWSVLYRNVLYDLKDARALAEGQGNKTAQIDLLSAYTYAILVDTYGDVPYTEALLGQEVPTPAYDDDVAVYNAMIALIDSALSSIGSGEAFVGADLVYGGDMGAWKKFGNTLKLKLAMRMSDYDSGKAQTLVSEALSGGVFTSNADNFILPYESSTPNTNPLWVDLVQSGRSDFVAANTIVDYMNTLEDPRRPFYFDQNLGAGVYEGGIYGSNNAYSGYSHIGDAMHEPAFRGVLMDYAEVEFMLAEAAATGFSVPGDAASHYEAGITASMEEWGVSSADIASYLAREDVAYATAEGTWREKIGLQYWLAMYNRGMEGWYVYRKFDAPVMNIPTISELPVPKRYTYPTSEANLNETNYDAAVAAMGGDTQQTSIFWDVN